MADKTICVYKFIVLSNAVEGKDEEFNDWYSNVHVEDALKIPGVIAATRFGLTKVQRRKPPFPYRYATIYEIETDDLAQTMNLLEERSGSPAMPVSGTFHPQHIALVFEEIMPRKQAAPGS